MPMVVLGGPGQVPDSSQARNFPVNFYLFSSHILDNADNRNNDEEQLKPQ